MRLPNLAVSACYLESHRLEKAERNTGDRRVHGQMRTKGKRKREDAEEKREERRTYPPTGGCNSNGRPRAYIYMSDLIACRNDINHSRLTYPRPFASRYLPPFSPLPTPPGPSTERERERETRTYRAIPANPRRPRVLPFHVPRVQQQDIRVRACTLVTAYIPTYEFFYLTLLYGWTWYTREARATTARYKLPGRDP